MPPAYGFVYFSCHYAGRDLASGLYFARLATPEYSSTIKLLLLK